jgi:hypothetical protein
MDWFQPNLNIPHNFNVEIPSPNTMFHRNSHSFCNVTWSGPNIQICISVTHFIKIPCGHAILTNCEKEKVTASVVHSTGLIS